MSFTFKWPRFSDDFHRDARHLLESALNKGNKPPIIADKIEVVELEMGTQPPELEIRDIGDLTLDQFRGIFRLSYAGDAHIVLRTKVQANPLNHKRPDIHMLSGSRGMLAAHQPLVVPMLLRLSHFRLNAYVVLVVSKQKGITLVFKTDPLQNVDVNSTFDSIAVIQKYIQREIEGQLREMFREDLPGIIHRLSQRWVTGKTRVEAPYLSKRHQQPLQSISEVNETSSASDSMEPFPNNPSSSIAGLRPSFRRQSVSHMTSLQRIQTGAGLRSAASLGLASAPYPALSSRTSQPLSHDPPPTFPDIENFDPTYGLRPDDLPAKSGYSGFGQLYDAPKGLKTLAGTSTEDETGWSEVDSFDILDREEITNSPSLSFFSEPATEYEVLPAVGGGVITRPRVYHSQSTIRPPNESSQTPISKTLSRSSSFAPSSSDQSSAGSMPRASATQAQPSLPQATQITLLKNSADPMSVRSQLSRPATFEVPTVSVLSTDNSSESQSPVSSFLPSSSDDTSYLPSQSEPKRKEASSNSSDISDAESVYSNMSQEHRWQRLLSSNSSPTTEGIAHGSPKFDSATDSDGNIILRPSLNNTVSHLSILTHSNHTLSPYTRSLEHFTVRSVPHRASSYVSASDRQPAKARRKRIYRLGSYKSAVVAVEEPEVPSSPLPPSEFEASDVDHYFRISSPILRRRASYRGSLDVHSPLPVVPY